jgi:transposase, IS30 family
MSHIQFNRVSRVELAVLLSTGKTQTACANILGMDRSNVCLEIKRNKDSDGIYRGVNAHKRYLDRRKKVKSKYKKILNDKKLRRHIVRKLKQLWSPEQISGRLKMAAGETVICFETIYTFVYEYRKDLVKYLRHQKSKYRRKRGSRARMELSLAPRGRMISERPKEVEERKVVGHWEDDTVVGKERTQRIWSCVERKSGFAMAEKLDTVTAQIIHEKALGRFRSLPQKVRKTLTRDNGKELSGYDDALEKKTGLSVYHANPYHSWERGSNENWNGLLRQFFPKGMYFATITQYKVTHAVRMLNDRPRKRLGYKTPREVFRGCCDSD